MVLEVERYERRARSGIGSNDPRVRTRVEVFILVVVDDGRDVCVLGRVRVGVGAGKGREESVVVDEGERYSAGSELRCWDRELVDAEEGRCGFGRGGREGGE